mmetsp:Transcript_22992/g.35175  ORF Transcript_22992/g.35175 Transcript_22992/m.35175 type:complete len:259 (+) Transcript_22992:239-1015(+)
MLSCVRAQQLGCFRNFCGVFVEFGTIGFPIRQYSGILTGRKLIHTTIVAIVHVVVNRIESPILETSLQPKYFARVAPPLRTTICRCPFAWCIIHSITISTACTLKGMKQPKPVSSFVYESIAFVVRDQAAIGHCCCLHKNHILVDTNSPPREIRITKCSIDEMFEKYIHGCSIALTKTTFHLGFYGGVDFGIVPIVVGNTLDSTQVKLKTCLTEGFVQHLELLLNIFLCDLAIPSCICHHMKPCLDVNDVLKSDIFWS